jgi:hypothetical protein
VAEPFAYRLFDTFNGETFRVHISRIQRDVFANAASGTMLVPEAKEIALVSESRHASAEARQLSENLRHILRNLV